MSLFPAYDNNSGAAPTSKTSDKSKEEWLENKSYKVHDRPRSRSPRRKRSPRRRSRSRSRSRQKSRRRSRSRSKKAKKKSSRRRSRSSSDEPSLNRQELIAKHSANKTFLEDVGVAPEFAFRYDNAGDKSLGPLSTLPISQTSSYKKRWKYERDELCSFRHVFKHFFKGVTPKRYHGKEFQKVFNKAERLQNLTDLSCHIRPSWTFEPRTYVRFIQELGKVDANDHDDDENDIKLHEIQLKTKEFNEKLRKDPQNIDLWLDYVDFQDVALGESDFTMAPINEEAEEESKKKAKKTIGNVLIRSKAIVEKKLSILKSALDKNAKSVMLAVTRLNLSKEILDSETLSRQWKELIFLFPGDVTVWDHYLTFLTSHFTTFNLSKICAAFKDCVRRLQEMAQEAFRTDHEDLEQQMTNILIRLCHLWSRSGHRERGVALFQALMEFNLFAPQFPGYFSSQDKLATFEPFWDSALPRFGEPGAPGWAHSKSWTKPENVGVTKDDHEEDELIAQFGGKVDNVQLWLRIELLRESKHWMPLRTDDDDEDEEIEDPDRVILYDQLEGLLFHFQDPCQVFKLFLACLHFLGLDEDLYREGQYEIGLLGTQTFHSWLGITHPEVVNLDDSEGLLLKASGLDSKAMIRTMFDQAITVFQEPFRTQIILLWLKYECTALDIAGDLAKAKKAKGKELKGRTMQILSMDQSNTRVYIGYAMALEKLEGYKAAKKVVDMALTAVGKVSFNDLGVYAAGLELKHGHCDNAIWILALMADSSSSSSSSSHKERPLLLRCNLDKVALLAFAHSALQKIEFKGQQQHYQNEHKSVPCMANNAVLAQLFALYWLTYLTDGLQAVIDLQMPNEVATIPLYREVMHKVKTDLFLYGEKSQKLAKNALLEWLHEFPNSPNALEVLTSRVSTLNVQTAVSSSFWRSVSSHLTGKGLKSPLGHIAVTKLLINQFKILQSDNDESDNMGSLFKAWRLLNEFVKHDPCRTCPQVWRLLMWTTKMLAKTNPYRYQPKTIFYRALQDNPSAKVFGLDLVHYQDPEDHHAEAVQAEIEGIFAEKEVRLRLPMEELRVLLAPE